jgi:hypothetical protein
LSDGETGGLSDVETEGDFILSEAQRAFLMALGPMFGRMASIMRVLSAQVPTASVAAHQAEALIHDLARLDEHLQKWLKEEDTPVVPPKP